MASHRALSTTLTRSSMVSRIAIFGLGFIVGIKDFVSMRDRTNRYVRLVCNLISSVLHLSGSRNLARLAFLLSVDGLLLWPRLIKRFISNEVPALVIAFSIDPTSAFRSKTACLSFEILEDSCFGDLDSWFCLGTFQSYAAAPIFS